MERVDTTRGDRIKTASEGMVLTNGEDFSDIGGSVVLGVNDAPENWYEITAEEAEERQKENLPEVDEA